MGNLIGLFLVLLLLAFCIADDAGAEPDTRGQPKGCKRKNNWRKTPKFYKEGKNVFKDCKKFTCTQPKRRKFVWVDMLDTKRCCSFLQTFYPIGSEILCNVLPDECTTVCVECIRQEGKATLDLVVEDDCPERPPETEVITEVPYDIKSPGHPNPYPPKQDICWSWTPICGNSAFLEFFDFDVLGHDAYVTIDPPISGQSKFWGNSFNSENAPPKTIGFPCDTVVMICFHSEKIVNGHTGFSAEIVDNPCTDWINSQNLNVPVDYHNCKNRPSRGYGPGIHHCDVRALNGETLNLDFCQFDIHSPFEGDYLTIHPNPTGKPKYYGTSLKDPDAPPTWSEYPGAGYLTVCFKTRQTVDDHKGYSAEIYPTVSTTTNQPGSESWDYSSSYVKQSTTTTTTAATTTATTTPTTTASSTTTPDPMVEAAQVENVLNIPKCGVKKTSRIVGGQETEVNEYPWMAALAETQSGDEHFFCAGTLISDQWVVTASHCLFKNWDGTDPLVSNELSIVLGEHDKADTSESKIPRKTVRVSKIITHENYHASNSDNDVALIKLADSVDLNVYTPACVANTGDNFVGKNAWVYGWGTLSFGGTIPDKLLEVEVEIVSKEVCKVAMGRFDITDGMLCAGGVAGKDGCQGDSGGPLTVDVDGQHYLVGGVSWGNGCGLDGQYGVYADTAFYRNWIDSILTIDNVATHVNFILNNA